MAENLPKLMTDCKTGLGFSGIWSRIIKKLKFKLHEIVEYILQIQAHSSIIN